MSTAAEDYRDLLDRVAAEGLMERDVSWYVRRMVRLGLGFLGAGVLFVLLGQSWWQLLTAALLSVLCTQAGFLAHDAAHRQIFPHAKGNEWTARIVGNLFVGLSYGWWMNKHSKHHANPNKIGSDLDIKTGVVVFDPADAPKRRGLAGWFVKRQGWFFVPLLSLVALDLHGGSAIRVLDRKARVPKRGAEIALLAVHLIGLPVAVFSVCGLGLGFAFLGVHLALFGLYMGGAFAPNHKGMPLVPKDFRIDFLRRQVLMSRNVSGGWFIAVAMGGLNYQVEHHLFPTMSSRQLGKSQPIVRAFCAERGIKYTETTLFESYRIVVRYLNRVGLGDRDPFSCPITAQLRTR